MTTTTIEIGTLITRSDKIRGGKPIIAGTGVSVNRIVIWYKLGLTPEEILSRMGHAKLDLAKIYAVLSYYHANQPEIEAILATETVDAQKSGSLDNVIDLVDQWLAEDSSYDEEVYLELENSLLNNAISIQANLLNE